MEFVKHL